MELSNEAIQINSNSIQVLPSHPIHVLFPQLTTTPLMLLSSVQHSKQTAPEVCFVGSAQRR